MFRMRKAASAVAAAALLATGAFVGVAPTATVPVANAQEVGGPVAGIPVTADLEIHKRIGLDGGVPADGTDQADAPGIPASGVTFSAFPVLDTEGGEPIDLTTNAGWGATQDVELATFFSGVGPNSYGTLNQNHPRLGEAETATTADETGIALFGDLPASLYLVVEHPNQSFNGQALAPSAPFLVTVPMASPGGTSWLDPVHVYPKNQVVEASAKTIFDPVPTAEGYDATGAAVGELMGYEIETTVPNLGSDSELGAFNVTDRLPAELGDAQDIEVTVGDVQLDEGDDYTIAPTWVVRTAEGAEHQILHVQLTQAGIAQLEQGDTVNVSFSARVESTPTGTLNNQAWTSLTDLDFVGEGDPAAEGNNPGTPSNTTRSVYGQINIQKTGPGGATPAGAVFELYRCTAEGDVVPETLPIQVGETTTWETGMDGTASIAGIHLANVNDIDAAADTYTNLWADTGTQFCLVEIEAPSGYSLLPRPVPVTMDYAELTTELVVVTQEVPNVETNAGFTLPMTGGSGIWLIIGAGVVLLVVAGGYYVIRKRNDA